MFTLRISTLVASGSLQITAGGDVVEQSGYVYLPFVDRAPYSINFVGPQVPCIPLGHDVQMALKFISLEKPDADVMALQQKMSEDVIRLVTANVRIYSHPHISPVKCVYVGVKFTASPTDTTYACGLAEPYYPNGNILTYTNAHPSVDKLRLITQAAIGLAYAHSANRHGIIHGNFYSGNVLINGNGEAVVADFGNYTMAAQEFHSRVLLPASVTYKPSEELGQDVVTAPTKAMDVYCWASTGYAVYKGEHPFFVSRSPDWRSRGVARISKAGNAGHTVLPKPHSMRDDLWKLFVACWDAEASKRPNMSQVVAALNQML